MKIFLHVMLNLTAVTMLTSPQQAWGAVPLGSAQLTPAFWVVLSMAIVTSFVALWSVLRRRDAIVRANEAEAIIQFSDAVLEEGALGYFTVHDGTTCYCSPRLQRWLGISESIISFKELEKIGIEATSDKDIVPAVFDKVRDLITTGEKFTCTYSPANTELIYLVRGARAKNDIDKNRQFDVIWFNNVTELDQGHSSLMEQLSKSMNKQAMLSQILDAAPFPVWSRNKNFSLEWVNKSYATAVEKKSWESVVSAQAELVIDSKTRPLQQIAKRALKEEKEQVEKHYVIINGKRHSLQVHEIPLPDSDSETVGFAIDVTRSEFLEAELGQHKAAHAETLNKLSSPVAIFGPDTTLRFYNNAFNNLWKLPSKWLMEEPTHSELLEALREKRQLPEHADFPAWKKHILSHYTGLLEPTEETWHLPNGNTLRVVTQPHPIGGILVLFEDVTDRLALERSYNTLIEVQRETLDNLHEAVAVFGSDGRLKLYNANYAKIWNLTPKFLNAEPHVKDVMAKIKNLLSDNGQGWDKMLKSLFNFIASRKFHTRQWKLTNNTVVEFSVVPLPDGATLFTISDETPKANITAALEERNKAMKAADRLKSEFIANMSYELRTPLNSIIGFSEILNLENYGELTPRQKDYVSAILSSSEKLKYLIDDILDLSIIEAGKMELDIEKFDLKAAVNKVLGMSKEVAHNKQVDLIFKDTKTKDTSLEGDLQRVTQAIYTILADSINRTDAKGSVSIEILGDAKTLSINITDRKATSVQTGEIEAGLIGITRDRLSVKGLNLGLSLVESFVKIHGGELSIEANIDGSRIVICTLPRKTKVKEVEA